MKIAFHTLGCKVNQYETEAIREKFQKKGYQIVDEKDIADIYIINTCTVTSLADRKSRQYIRKMKKLNPDSVIAVTGCYVQTNKDDVLAIDEVSLVVGTNEKGKILEYIEQYIDKDSKIKDIHVLEYEQINEYEETGIITSMDTKTRGYIKIQEGCNRFCSYCIIPYARGNIRSRGLLEIVEEARGLLDKGFKEIVLTGINTALYGMDNKEGKQGVEQIIKILNSIEGEFRIRLSSLEPTVVDKEYVSRLFKYEKLCHHLHLSAQSGSDVILSKMNRGYKRSDYLELVKTIREFDPYYGITTDLICGFPGESQNDLEESLRLIDESLFCKVHAFKYSKREGTKAAAMDGQIPSEIKSQRMEAVIKKASIVAKSFFNKCIGQEQIVLVESLENGMLAGYSDNYIKVYIKENNERLVNNFVKVILSKPFKDGMLGELI